MSIVGKAVAGTPLLTAISDATAEQWNVKAGTTAYIVGGVTTGTAYTPAMMQYDGTTGYYNKTGITTSGNKVVAICRFNRSSFTGNKAEQLYLIQGVAQKRILVTAYSSDYSDSDRQNKISVSVANSGGTNICLLFTSVGFLDGNDHTLFSAFDGDAGTAIFIIDGQSVDDTGNADRVAPTTGTLDSSAASQFSVGAWTNGTSPSAAQVGFCGYHDTYLTNWSDFMQTDGTPKELDTIGWTQWNAGVSQTPMMQFTCDGTTNGYSKTSLTTSGNKVTGVCRVSASPFSGGSLVYPLRVVGGASVRVRLGIFIAASDYATAAYQSKIGLLVQNSAGATIALLCSPAGHLDGTPKTVFAQFDGDAGTASLIIQGVDADDTGNAGRVAPTTGTLESGAAGAGYMGVETGGTSTPLIQVGYYGYRDAGGLTYTDFMEADGTPKEIDEIAWQQWGGQPIFWNKGGLMTDNKGSAGAMTENGTVTGPSGGWPLFWNHHGEMSNNLGSAGAATKNGVIVVGNGGNT